MKLSALLLTDWPGTDLEADLNDEEAFGLESFDLAGNVAQNGLKTIFDQHCQGLLIDAGLAARLHRFQFKFVNKTADHLEFFSGNLTGVHTVRFTDQDFHRYFEDVLQLDAVVLTQAVRSLPQVKAEWKVSGDVFNLTSFYLMHRILTASELEPKLRHRAALDTALIFGYRCLTSLLAWYFKYTADESVAKATYASLTNRFLLKKLGTWQNLLLYRAEDLISPQNPQHPVLKRFAPDAGVLQLVNSGQGRLREHLKEIYDYHIRALHHGGRITTSSHTGLTPDGEDAMKDTSGSVDRLIDYLFSVAGDADTLIQRDVLQVAASFAGNCPKDKLEKVIRQVSSQLQQAKQEETEALLQLSLLYAYHYLQRTGFYWHGPLNVPGFLNKLKGGYTSAKSQEVELERLRELGEALVRKAVPEVSPHHVAALRLGLFLFIALRVYARAAWH